MTSVTVRNQPSSPSRSCANERTPTPRARGVTEIRGPCYSVMGPRFKDVLETVGDTSTRSSSPAARSR